jgi:multicomponent Na+:H+ antiporter subunit E
MILFVINLMLAFLWMLWLKDFGPWHFISGFIVGFLALLVFKPLFKLNSYYRRCFYFGAYIVLFIKEVTLSTWTIARAVMFLPVEKMNPNILTMDISQLSDLEVLILTNSITLTPGTTSVDVSADRKVLYIHAFDDTDPEQVRKDIQEKLLKPILRFTR